MKINWGVGIVLALLAFITFIMSFVVTMFTDKDYQHEMVVEEYYKQELGFEDELEAERNAQSLLEKVLIEETDNGVTISFPEKLMATGMEGIVSFYRPSNQYLDFETPIVLEDQQMFVPNKLLAKGRWNISVQWNYMDKPYILKKNVNLK